MNEEEIQFVRQALYNYLEVRNRHGYDVPLNSAEISHSSLLHRLLSGKPPLTLPPPCRYSYPWYDLIESGEGWVGPPDVPRICGESGITLFDLDTVIICQSPQWKLVEKKSDKDWIVRCMTNNQLFRCYQRDDYPIWGFKGEPDEDHPYGREVGEIHGIGWKLERIVDND